MNPDVLKNRTKVFALRVIKMIDSMPQNASSKVIGNQLLRSSTSVGANYSSALRARSKAEFISKLGIVLEEVDESSYWIEIISELGLIKKIFSKIC